jgi:hypothetical protein
LAGSGLYAVTKTAGDLAPLGIPHTTWIGLISESIVILQPKTWKNSPSLFHVLLLLFNIMENKSKFKPNPKLRLMDQVRHPDEPEP